jgi:eukaryotic-like serine/threonine-protein kinase
MSTDVAKPRPAKAETRLGGFVLLDEMTGTSAARLFRARYRPRTGQPTDVVARLQPEDIVVVRMLRDAAVRDSKLINSFTRDGELLAMIDHPNVVRAHTRGVTNGRIWSAVEYVEGNDLRGVLQVQHRDQLRLRPEVALVVALDVLSGLAAAQALLDPRSRPMGLIHRLLGPQHVLIDLDGQSKLADVDGVFLSTREEPPGDDPGIPGYLSPEAARGDQLTQNSDVFAIGVLLYEMLTGRRAFPVDALPHKAMVQAHANNDRQAWPKGQDLPLDVVHLVDQLTAASPETRPRDANAAFALVEGLLDDQDDARRRLAWVARDLALSDPDRLPPMFATNPNAMNADGVV